MKTAFHYIDDDRKTYLRVSDGENEWDEPISEWEFVLTMMAHDANAIGRAYRNKRTGESIKAI